MLFLLDKDVRTVKWNGIPLHEASSAIVKEETNGDFYLTVNYPITDSGIYQLIKEDMLIKAPVPVLGAQLFRIKKPVENDDSLDITAYHITDDVMKRSITPVSVVGQGCAMALSQMVQNAKTGLGDFSFTSDIMDSRTYNTTETETLYSVLLDGKHSIVGTWEGELVRDNFALSIKRSRCTDRGVVITTHKNLKSYQRTKNSQNVVTRIHAKSTFKAENAETDTVLTVTVDSPLIGNYPYINEKEYENNDAKTSDELKKWAEAKFTNEGIDKVSDAIEIEAYELDGQVVNLGDIVNIKSRKHDVDLYKKAIAYEYNALTEEYISITFDDKPGVGGSGVSSGVSNAADVILSANQNAQEVAIERAVRNANKAFDAGFNKRVEVINDSIEQSKADAEAYADNIKQSIDADINAVNQSMQEQSEEHDRQVADILSKTQSVEALANQAKTDAANAIAEAIRLDTVERQATETKLATAKSQAVAEATQMVETAKSLLSGQISNVSTDLSQTKEAIKLLATSATVDALTGRISSAESALQVQAGEIASRVKTSDFDQAKQRISTAESSITQLGNRITTEIGTVEGKIPTFVGGRNLIRALNSNNYRGILAVNEEGVVVRGSNGAGNTLQALYKAKTSSGNHVFSYSMKEGSSHRVLINIYDENEKKIENKSIPGWTWNVYYKGYFRDYVSNNGYVVFNAPSETRYITGVIVPPWNEPIVNYTLLWMKLEKGTVATDWTPAPEDIADEISSVKTTITQTSQGVEQLTASLATTDGKVTTAETKINQLIGDVSSKVSQTEYNTLTGRVSSAETAITQNATEISKRLTSTQVEQAITDKGYATVTVLNNKVKETADSFSRTISETRALIPTFVGGRNLLLNTSSEKTVNRNFDHLISRPLEIGKLTYTVWLKANRDTIVNVYLNDDTGQNRTGLDFAYNLQITTEYKKYTLTKTLTNFTGTEINSIFMRVYGLDDDIITGKEAKLETGNVATDWSPAPEELATVTALHAVTDTVDSHTRTIGAVGTTGSILDNVSKVTQTANGLVQEVSGANGLKTQVSTLAGSYAIKNLTKAGDVLGQINLNPDGSVRINEGLISVGTKTYIQDGVISSAKIASLDAGKIKTGTLDAARIATNSITGSHIVFDQAFVNKMTANEAMFKQLFAQNAFITSVQAVTLSASKISGGILTATNGAMEINLNAGQILHYTGQAALKRVLNGYPTQFIKFSVGTQSTDNAFRLIGAGSSSSIGASIASFGTNRNNGENNLDGGFTGVNIYSGGTTGTNVVDRIELASDILQIAHAASTGIANDPRGWTFENQNSVNNNYVFRPNTRPNSAYKALIGTSVTPINELYIDEAYIKGQRLGWILRDIANRIGHNGWADNIT